MILREITLNIIGVFVIIAALLSIFIPVNAGAEELVRILAGIIVGFYFGKKEVPFAAFFKKPVNQ